MQSTRCTACDEGSLELHRIARSSPAVALIGWVLVFASVFGVVGSGFGAMASVAVGAAGVGDQLAATRNERIEATFGPQFTAAGLPRAFLADLIEDPYQELLGDVRDMTREQASVYANAQAAIVGARTAAEDGDSAAAAAAGLGLVVFAILGGVALIGGLFGWLLVRKKSMLVCDACAATVAAG